MPFLSRLLSRKGPSPFSRLLRRLKRTRSGSGFSLSQVPGSGGRPQDIRERPLPPLPIEVEVVLGPLVVLPPSGLDITHLSPSGLTPPLLEITTASDDGSSVDHETRLPASAISSQGALTPFGTPHPNPSLLTDATSTYEPRVSEYSKAGSHRAPSELSNIDRGRQALSKLRATLHLGKASFPKPFTVGNRRFTFDKVLGAGSSAKVYRAFSISEDGPEDARCHAIKVIQKRPYFVGTFDVTKEAEKKGNRNYGGMDGALMEGRILLACLEHNARYLPHADMLAQDLDSFYLILVSSFPRL